MISVTTAPFCDLHELFADPCFNGSNALSHVFTREGDFYAHSLLRTFLFDGEENINMNCLKQSLSGEFQYPMYSPVCLLLHGHGNSGHLEGTNLHRLDRDKLTNQTKRPRAQSAVWAESPSVCLWKWWGSNAHKAYGFPFMVLSSPGVPGKD